MPHRGFLGLCAKGQIVTLYKLRTCSISAGETFAGGGEFVQAYFYACDLSDLGPALSILATRNRAIGHHLI